MLHCTYLKGDLNPRFYHDLMKNSEVQVIQNMPQPIVVGELDICD